MITSGFFWLQGKLSIRQVTSVARKSASAQDPDAPTRFFRPQNANPAFQFEGSFRWICSRTLRKNFQTVEFLKTADTADLQYTVAMSYASTVSGLKFLPIQLRRPIQLRVASTFLARAEAPQEAINRAELELEEYGVNRLIDALFTIPIPDGCDASETEAMSYFEKYFQHLLVAFGKLTFLSSSDSITRAEQEVLVDHLRCLTERRVVAARITEQTDPEIVSAVLSRMCKPLPSSISARAERQRIKTENKHKAVSILLVVDFHALGLGRAVEIKVEDHSNKLPNPYDSWLPDTSDTSRDTYCFYWREA